ncbi:MAG: CoA transferase [Acidimicrobiales bacterium]
MDGGPLAGVRVLELPCSLAGAYATKLLVDAGAEVTMIEPPEGAPLRRWLAGHDPLPEGTDGPLFTALAAGKASAMARPGAGPAERGAVLAAGRAADIVVCGPTPITPDEWRAAAPGAVVVCLSPFGSDSRWADRPATEFTVQALSGGPAHRGAPGTDPISVGGQHGEWALGTFGAAGALAGLHRRARTGTGELVDVSMLEALIMTPHFQPITYQSMAGSAYFEGRRPRYPGDIEPTADGFVGFALVNTLQPWLDFCALIGRPDWAEDTELHNPGLRAARYDELIGPIRAWTTARTTAEIVEVASAMRIPVAPIGHGANVTTMDHFVEQGFFQRSADGSQLRPSPPFRFAGRRPDPVAPAAPPIGPPLSDPASPTGTPAPGASLAGSSRSPQPTVTRPPSSGEPAFGELPFQGLRILDLTAFWAGPFATHLPALLGAEVLHVESPKRLDGARSIVVRGADPEQWWEWSHAFQGVNTNKHGVSIDLSDDRGLAVLRRLVASCDAVVENFSPRVLDGWGLDEAAVRAIRPDVVYLRMPAFGLAGPWRDRVGFAMTMEQVSGLAWMTGPADGPPVTLLGPCDPVGGAHGTIALLAALWHRARTGRGMLVEVPMVAGALNLAAEQVAHHSATGELLTRAGNRGPAAAPQNTYRCADPPTHGEARHIAVAVATDDQWQALRAVLGAPAWADDPAFATAAGRRRHHDRLDRELGAWCATRPAADLVERLVAAGVPAAPVLVTGELLDLAPLHDRGFLEPVDHPVTGTTLHTTYPARFSGGPSVLNRRAAPVVGRDTLEVLRTVAGYSAEELDALAATGLLSDAV